MRSLVMRVFLVTSAILAVLGEVLVSLSQDPLLVRDYGTTVVLAAVAGVLFWLQFRYLDQQEAALNHIAEGCVDEGRRGLRLSL